MTGRCIRSGGNKRIHSGQAAQGVTDSSGMDVELPSKDAGQARGHAEISNHLQRSATGANDLCVPLLRQLGHESIGATLHRMKAERQRSFKPLRLMSPVELFDDGWRVPAMQSTLVNSERIREDKGKTRASFLARRDTIKIPVPIMA